MTGSATVAREKRPKADEETGTEGELAVPAEDEKVSVPVKLRPTFKKRLQRVAEEAGVDMGILIERYMNKYISREYKRLIQADLDQLGD